MARLEDGAVVHPGVFTVAAAAQALEVTVDSLLVAATSAPTGHEGRTIESFVALRRRYVYTL